MEAPQLGDDVRSIMLGNGCYKWEAYYWQGQIPCRKYTSCGIFDHKWEAEQYFYNITNAR